jgi:hypothetical protein
MERNTFYPNRKTFLENIFQVAIVSYVNFDFKSKVYNGFN